ncbi:MAG: AEC family transporter, partial [Spirulinaceae cyanobacterium]
GLERAIVYLIAASITMASIAPALLKGEGLLIGIKLTLKLPLLWAMLGGLCLRIFKIELPFSLYESLEMLGNASIPIALIILGLQLAQTPFRLGRYELFASALRLLLAPGIAYGVGSILGLTGLDLQVLVMQGAMPTAVNTLVWVTEFGGDPPRVARTIIVSTMMSFLTLPLVLWVIS